MNSTDSKKRNEMGRDKPDWSWLDFYSTIHNQWHPFLGNAEESFEFLNSGYHNGVKLWGHEGGLEDMFSDNIWLENLFSDKSRPNEKGATPHMFIKSAFDILQFSSSKIVNSTKCQWFGEEHSGSLVGSHLLSNISIPEHPLRRRWRRFGSK